MKRQNVDRALGHDLPGTPSNGDSVGDDTAASNEHARVVRLDDRRASRDAAGVGNSDQDPLPVALAVEAMRFPRDRGVAAMLASDGPIAGRVIQLALMALGVAVAFWVAAQLAKPDLGAGDLDDQQASAAQSPEQ